MPETCSESITVDLDAYCARIGYDGPRTPTLATLRALHELHPAAIPFEAIDVLLGRGVDTAPAAIDAKLIGGRRGGYCHEHNGLFKRVLMAIGFPVESLMARVLLNVPIGKTMPRGHVALRVMVDGAPWLADVGFGGCVATAPLRMDTPEPQRTRHEAFRILPKGDELLLELQPNGGGQCLPMYELVRQPQVESDFEMMNWYSATHPESLFRKILMVARVTPQARYTLRDSRLTVRFPGGETEQRILDAAEIEQVLADIFGLPVEPAWRPVIARAASMPA